jgi:hypothetical protein
MDVPVEVAMAGTAPDELVDDQPPDPVKRKARSDESDFSVAVMKRLRGVAPLPMLRKHQVRIGR